ncbi:MAG: hypothetical protein Q9163_005033 [Psora crenata]
MDRQSLSDTELEIISLPHNTKGLSKMTQQRPGQVIGEAQGSEDDLESYLTELNAGPRAAHVLQVDTEKLEVTDGESTFGVR